MNFPYPLLHEVWYWLSWCLWLPLVLLAAGRARWARFGEEGGRFLNVWLAMIVVFILLWSMKAGIKPGLDLHLTGIMLFTLAFGPALAFLGLNLVFLGLTLNGAIGWQGFALNALATAGIGVALATLIHRAVDRFFPRHFFIFIFLKGFFGAALTILGIGFFSVLLYGLDGAYDWNILLGEYFPPYLLLGFSEAWLSCMALTLMVVYYPRWVVTFDDKVYLVGK
ncbi:MAG: energy-coupling factor ABC transporter permease [Zoogloeaceae bacterium]|jgi:uncharacterized membrane protein|nr:energy-coupling factor ABC transporter permease [Zoogloeaceae bacterium]